MRAHVHAVLLIVGGFLAAEARSQELLIRNARLIDGTGAAPRAGVSILVRDGVIAEIGDTAAAPAAPSLDVRGATVLPGLIDAHVHLKSGPGSFMREPTPEARSRLHPHHLRAYLACGVTTVLDAAAVPRVVREVRASLAAGNPGPRYLVLGPFLSPPNGYPADPNTSQSVATVEQLEAMLDEIQALGAVGVKVPVERGWSPLAELPTHPPAMLRAIKTGAERRGLSIYVHATSEADQLVALEMGGHALVHPILYRDEDLSDAFVARMAREGTYQISTLSIMDAPLAKFHPERLRDPLLDLVVPAVELAAAREPGSGWVEMRSNVGTAAPWLPGFLRDAVARWRFREHAQTEALQRSQRALRRLHEAGVPIVVGSDTPYQDWAVYAFHGPSTLREIELVAQTGLSPMQALEAATRVPAEMLGLAHEIGTVEVGKRADLVIVSGDPLQDLRALRSILWTVRDGVVHTPREWMTR